MTSDTQSAAEMFAISEFSLTVEFHLFTMSSADMPCPAASISCDGLGACFCINQLDQAHPHKCQKEKSLCEPHESSSPHLPRRVSIGFT